MAVCVDPGGAVFAIWQAKDHIGSQIVNEPNSLAWNELRTRDTDGAKKFYGEVFGWGAMGFEAMGDYVIWTLGGNAPENGKGGMVDLAGTPMPAEVPPHWDVAFAVEDADATVAKCEELGGGALMAPMDTPVGRLALLRAPDGATFTVIKLVAPEDAPASLSQPVKARRPPGEAGVVLSPPPRFAWGSPPGKVPKRAENCADQHEALRAGARCRRPLDACGLRAAADARRARASPASA